LITLDFV